MITMLERVCLSIAFWVACVILTPAASLAAIPRSSSSLPTEGAPVTVVTDPEVLLGLEAEGLSFNDILAQRERRDASGALDNARLYERSPGYRSVVDDVSASLDAMSARDDYTFGAESFAWRLFNKDWLRSPHAVFELIGVVPRLDRSDFHAARDVESCGELRLLYRLSYHRADLDEALYSRMPFVINVIYRVPSSPQTTDCGDVARRWLLRAPIASDAQYAAWLGARIDLTTLTFEQLEINLQSMRIPSESKPDLGGHAEYMLRVFSASPTGAGLARAPLENTPDVERIRRDPELRAELLTYIKDHVDEIDQGVYQLPQHLLAREAVSVGPSGQHRTANHPFSQLFEPEALADVELSSARLMRSPQALLMRLNDGTCTGCHQSASTAGFHLLGEDRADTTHRLNALRLAGSPHFTHEQTRRAEYWRTVAADASPETRRPLSFAPSPGEDAPVGGRCILDDDRARHLGAGAEGWSCVSGARCVRVVDGEHDMDLGMCVRDDAVSVAGDPCWRGELEESHRGARKDALSRERFGCEDYACLTPKQGAPLGMCQADCAEGDGTNHPDELCAWRGSVDFERCAARGNWASCVDASARRGLRAACDEATPCREDFICQRSFAFDGEGWSDPEDDRGYCVPNYFLFQLRLDGHPHDPLGGSS